MRGRITARIISQSELSPGIFDLRLDALEIAEEARAGQFVDLFCADGARLLPRPISLAGIDTVGGALRLIYRVSGEGTKSFSRLKDGDTIDVIGPLGNGFPAEEASGKDVLLIGGGIGIPPLLAAARAMSPRGEQNGAAACRVTAVLGYRNADTFLADEFAEYCDVFIATEDGSAGTRGTVMDILNGGIAGAISKGGRDAVIFACGPAPMLRALQEYAEENGVPAWLSLEERMACGVGACLACVCRTRKTDGHSMVNNSRVCKDGPVFPAGDVII